MSLKFYFKTTIWEEIEVPEEHQSYVLEKIKADVITTGNELYDEADKASFVEHLKCNMIYDTQEALWPKLEDPRATLEVTDADTWTVIFSNKL